MSSRSVRWVQNDSRASSRYPEIVTINSDWTKVRSKFETRVFQKKMFQHQAEKVGEFQSKERFRSKSRVQKKSKSPDEKCSNLISPSPSANGQSSRQTEDSSQSPKERSEQSELETEMAVSKRSSRVTFQRSSSDKPERSEQKAKPKPSAAGHRRSLSRSGLKKRSLASQARLGLAPRGKRPRASLDKRLSRPCFYILRRTRCLARLRSHYAP